MVPPVRFHIERNSTKKWPHSQKKGANSLSTELQLKLPRKISKLNLKDLAMLPMPTTVAKGMLSSPMSPRNKQIRPRRC